MKKKIINFLLIGAMTPLLIQCASQSDLDDLRYQLRIVNKKIEDMKSTTVGQLQKRQAASSGQMDQLSTELLELKSQLEETNHTNRRLRENNKELEQSITSIAQTEASKRNELLLRIQQQQEAKELELNQLNEKIRLQNENVKAIQEARIRDAERRVKAAARAAELAKAKARAARAVSSSRSGIKHILVDKKKITYSGLPSYAVPVTPKVNKPVKSVSSGSKTISSRPQKPAATISQMAKAEKLYARNKLGEAFKIFEQIANGAPSNDSVNARYMMGECLFKQKEYDKAIMQYQKIISQYSGHEKAPAAMLRQGIAFEKLSDKDTAKVIYKKILKRHGSSPEAIQAKKFLDKL